VSDWPALRAARAQDAAARVPFSVNGRLVGSVARANLRALRAWPGVIRVGEAEVALNCAAADLQDTLRGINDALRGRGLILGWRDELFALFDPATLTPLARMERAATRFWGTPTLGAHATGYVADAQGRPSHLWIAQRSMSKATDPGKFDNLIGGGVPDGQTPWQALLREGWEEAGLDQTLLHRAVAGPVLRVQRDIPEGLQHEWLHCYDLQLPPGTKPVNQDGEVAAFACLPLVQALALAAGETMTVDAALVTLDFALRHGLLPSAQAQALEARLRALQVDPAGADAGVQSN